MKFTFFCLGHLRDKGTILAISAAFALFGTSVGADQDSLRAVYQSTLVAQKPTDPTKPFLATFGWAGGCGDVRVQAWSEVAQGPGHRWNLVPVPIETIKDHYEEYEDTGALYYVVSHEMEKLNCQTKYLSGALGCDSDAHGRRVQLWHNKDEEGVQWWNVVAGPGGGFVLENFYNKNWCTGNNMYLGTDNASATRFNDLTYKGLNFNWNIAGLNLPPTFNAANATVQPGWEFMCQRGSTKCEATSNEMITVSSSLAKNWSNELETSLSTTLATSVTAGFKSGGGTPLETSGSATVSTSITAGLRAAVKTSKGETLNNGETKSNSLTCSPPIPLDRDVYRYTVAARLGNDIITMKSCRFACTNTGQSPTWGPTENMDSCM